MAEEVSSTREKPFEEGVVYFWGNVNRRIKIGFTAQPDLRLRTLRYQFGPMASSFLVTVDGTAEDERAYHKRFAEHRHGKSEWFAPHPDILAEIDRLIAEQSLAIDGMEKTG